MIHPLLHSHSNTHNETCEQHEKALVKETTHTAHTVRPAPHHNLHTHSLTRLVSPAPAHCPKVKNDRKLTFKGNQSAERHIMQNLAWTTFLLAKKSLHRALRAYIAMPRGAIQSSPNAAAPVSPITFPLKSKHVNVLLACGFKAAMLRDKIPAECAGTKKRTL